MLSHTFLVLQQVQPLAQWLQEALGFALVKQACEGHYLELRVPAITESSPPSPADTGHVLALTTATVMQQFAGFAPPLYQGGCLLSLRYPSLHALTKATQRAQANQALVLQPLTTQPWGQATLMLSPPQAVLSTQLLLELNCPTGNA